MSKSGPSAEVGQWMDRQVEELRKTFGDRLLCVGLQGSCRRGEETPESDIDVVVILDEVTVEDLASYRAIVEALPHPEKACGFISGERELRNWARHELFHFKNDTLVWYGDLDALLPELDMEDLRDSVRTAVGNLYHSLAHLYVHGDRSAWPAGLRVAFRSTFYILQTYHYLQTDCYVHTRRKLFHALPVEDRHILEIGLEWANYEESAGIRPDKYFSLLLRWCSDMLEIFRVRT